jgi:hypothetical protein
VLWDRQDPGKASALAAMPPGGLRYQCGNGRFSLFESTGVASGIHTQMGWSVDDIEAVVSEPRRRGVVFEQVDVPGLRTVDASRRWRATTLRLASASVRPGSATAKGTCSASAKPSANGKGWRP